MSHSLKTPFSLNECDHFGQQLKIYDLQGIPALVERLRELGLHPGLRVEYAGQAPFKGPRMIRIGSAVIALRGEEAACVLLLPL